ncbi:MAG: nucleotidyltransferase domain-containing protein [Candidatus Omnitrophica bacterium]|nr:nucleotidyltransferase domain-containing protein [Candidatus Omnitrophota bacterium]
MLNNLFSSKARVDVLKLFLVNPENSYYQRQVSTLTHQPIRAVQREVERLEKLGLLIASHEGNRAYYKVNKKCPIFEELKSIIFKSAGIAESLKKNLKASTAIKVAFIYGSYAKGEENISSDIDLMVIGSISSRELSRSLSDSKSQLAREINYSVFSPHELIKRVRKGDHFIKTILKDKKIFIIGDINELKSIIKSR